jgi:acyl-coenzyme A synthetase/AMP-(fatty) acid ligase
MKRAVLCVSNPWDYYDQLQDWSVMTVNPNNTPARQKYLLDHSDWSMKITASGVEYRDGRDHPGEKMLAYTSGTTGDSKFYSFSQTQIDHCVDTICQAYNLNANDRYVGIMPLWHAHGQAFYWATKKAQCETHFISVANLRLMPDYHPTFVTAIPDLLKTIGQLKFDSLRFIRSASSAMPDWLYKDLRERFQIPIIEAFGMTEAYSHCFTNPLHGEQRLGTVGLPSGIEAYIDNGHLLIRGPGVYCQGWIDTGDLAKQDSAGYYQVLGRSVDRINVKGYKFDPVSLEQQLIQLLPEIKECVIFGREKINCLYTGSVTQDQIRLAMRKIHPFCRVSFLNLVDSIPLSPNGKISRTWLKEKFNCQ